VPNFQGRIATHKHQTMASLKSAVAMGLVAASSAFAVPSRGLAFAGPALPLPTTHGHALAAQRQPALRQAKAGNLKVGALGARATRPGRPPVDAWHARASVRADTVGAVACVCGLLCVLCRWSMRCCSRVVWPRLPA